ncbi:MAG: malto-oligosyltrehalose trehalohydrolase [Actinomycetota bacterium]|nr:malto-oligosyltrehalose trehalohydrolase [Actinomycetota bacterium]
MTVLSVWAPRAGRVEVEVGGSRQAMSPGERGWWWAEVPDPQVDYAFALDGGPSLPDPRSAWQPFGVHAPSRTLDHSSYCWEDGSWKAGPLSSAVVYELHVGTFTEEGTFEAATKRLDHLVDLGITHLELMPVNEFSGIRGWGYDGVDLFAPHHAYGGPEGLKRLVDACHRAGLAVIMDVVYNHLGPEGNYLGRFGPYFTNRYHTPWGAAINLDGPGSDEVRRFLCDNAVMWLRDYHLDGLRIDAVHAIFDMSAVHFLEQLADEVRKLEARLGRHLVVIAESDLNDPRLVRPPEAGGYGLDAQWSDDFHHALWTVLTGEQDGYYADFGSLGQLAKSLRNAYVYEGQRSVFRERRHGRPPGGVPGERFLGYLQNHDQVGNRGCGERSSEVMSRGRLEVGAALVLTAPFVPMLFQGEEWGASTPFLYFSGHEDPELGEAVRRGRREEFAGFGWDPQAVPDPQDPDTYRRAKLDWGELGRPPHADLLEWHRKLIRLRRRSPSLVDGRRDLVQVRHDERARWLVMQRSRMTVAVNLASAGQVVPAGGRIVLASSQAELDREGVKLPPESVAILEST